MPITQCVPTSGKTGLLSGTHEPTDVYKIALYSPAATLDETITAYTVTDEVAGGGYTAGGEILTGIALGTDGTIAWMDFDDISWPGATFTAAGALIYNSSKFNSALIVLDFNGSVVSTGGTFSITFPAIGVTALLRLN